MDFQAYKFELYSGWPPDGEVGAYFGFDPEGNVSVLRWINGAWHGLRFQKYTQGRHQVAPEYFRRADDTESYVIQWAAAPWGHKFEERCAE